MKKILLLTLSLLLLAALCLPASALTIDTIDGLGVIENYHSFGYDINPGGDIGGVRFCLMTVQTNTSDSMKEASVATRLNIGDGDAVVLVVQAVGRSLNYYYTMYTFGAT